VDIVEFGKTGLSVSRLAFGTGTHGWAGRSEQTDLGVDKLASLLRLAYDHGVNFWDAADTYGSHPHVAKALKGLPRDEVVIATKTTSRTAAQVTQDVERFLRELGTDVLDIVLLHFVTQADWPQRYAGAMEALSQAKEQGQVRAVGVSCHGVNMDAPPSRVAPVIERLYASGKAVYGMKVLGCGQLVRKARAAIQYALQLGVVHSVVIGTSRRDHLLKNVKLVEELAPQCPLRTL
jgi:aryl-alcohol dehydrogenase-like predicted oxidoreductase